MVRRSSRVSRKSRSKVNRKMKRSRKVSRRVNKSRKVSRKKNNRKKLIGGDLDEQLMLPFKHDYMNATTQIQKDTILKQFQLLDPTDVEIKFVKGITDESQERLAAASSTEAVAPSLFSLTDERILRGSKLGELPKLGKFRQLKRHYLFLPNHQPPLFLVIQDNDISKDISRDENSIKKAILDEYTKEDHGELSKDSIDLSLGGGAVYAPRALGEGGFALHGFTLKNKHTLFKFKSSSEDGLEIMVNAIKDIQMGFVMGDPPDYNESVLKKFFKIKLEDLKKKMEQNKINTRGELFGEEIALQEEIDGLTVTISKLG